MIDTHSKVADIVVGDYRSASVFRKHGIDFCCGGGKELERVCEEKKIDIGVLLKELEARMSEKPQDTENYRTWPLDRLADHIEEKHHSYVGRAIEDLKQYLGKVVKVHGQHNPELIPIHEKFRLLAGELTSHMRKEELILFPYIRKMERVKRTNVPLSPPMFGTIRNPIAVMEEEHTGAGNYMAEIRELSSDYLPPGHACNTYMVAYRMLDEFEGDLHLHVHLENNILFPGAIRLEKELLRVVGSNPYGKQRSETEAGTVSP